MLDKKSKITELRRIMQQLRDPETGCAWDCAQDFESIAPYTIEEAYEVVDAIARADMKDLQDELGDLLFQVIFHAQMASEKNQFNFDDVVTSIIEKLYRRHPHIFANEEARNWEDIKAEERGAKKKPTPQETILEDIPLALPALKRSEKIQSRVIQAGFKWETIQQARQKLDEEIAELDAEIATHDHHRMQEEFGDVLLTLTSLAYYCNINSEAALESANRRFCERFQHMEIHADKALDQLSADEWEQLWQAAKKSQSHSSI